MFGSKSRNERNARREANASYWDNEAAKYDQQIKELQQHRKGDSEAVRFGERQLGSQKWIAEQNAAGFRVGQKQKRR
jgi:hypothetical protein